MQSVPRTTTLTRVKGATINDVQANRMNQTVVDSQAALSASLLHPIHPPPQLNSCNYVEHGIDQLPMSIDKTAASPPEDMEALELMFRECDVEVDSEDIETDLPPLALTASLDKNDWELSDEPVAMDPSELRFSAVCEPVPHVERPNTIIPRSSINVLDVEKICLLYTSDAADD